MRLQNLNSLSLSIFVFQYGLFIPFDFLLGGKYLIVAFTLISILYFFIRGEIRFNIYILCILLLPVVLLSIKFPFEFVIYDDNDVLVEMLLSFLTLGVSGILFGTISVNTERFVYHCYRVAWINFLLIFYIPFTSMYGDVVNYMRLGYALLPIAIVSFYFYTVTGNLFALGLFVLSLLEMFIYGSRGSSLTFFLFASVYFIVVSKSTFYDKLLFLVLLSLIMSIIIYFLDVLVALFYSLNIDSYSVSKYLYLYEGRSLGESSSGRDDIWSSAINRALESPFFGSPINSSFVDTGSTYYHNVFLDVLVNFGVFGLLFSTLIITLLLVLGFRAGSRVQKFTILFLFMVPFGRLLVSSSFWQRPDFWFFLSFSISLIKYKKPNL